MRYPHHTPNDSLRNLQVRKIKEIKNVCGKSVAAPLTLQKTKQNVSTAICYCLEIGKWFFLFIFELDRKKCTLSPIFRRGSGKGRKKKEWDAFKVWHFSVLRLISLLKCVYLLSHPPFSTLSVLTSLSFLWVYASVSCLSLLSLFSWCTEVTNTTSLSTTATFSAMRLLSFSPAKRSHHTSQTFHLTYYPRESTQFNKRH